MSELALTIGTVALSFEGGAGHVHRTRTIGRRALALLHTYLEQRMVEWGLSGSIDLERLIVPRVAIDISLAADDEVAERLANAICGALAAQLLGSR
jgi:hypothetical protein